MFFKFVAIRIATNCFVDIIFHFNGHKVFCGLQNIRKLFLWIVFSVSISTKSIFVCSVDKYSADKVGRLSVKLKFKKQAYQTRAVDAVVNCFEGQPHAAAGFSYRIDPGVVEAGSRGHGQERLFEESGFKNEDIVLTEEQVLENIQKVQRIQNLPQSASLITNRCVFAETLMLRWRPERGRHIAI